MRAFRVGQRVRVMAQGDGPARLFKQPPVPSGKEAVIVHGGYGSHYLISVDGVRNPRGADGWFIEAEYLRPLGDPAADQFIERVKSWKPEPVAPALPVKVKS